MPNKIKLTTPGQRKFVRENMEAMTLKQMGALLDLSITDIYRIVLKIKAEVEEEKVNEPREVKRIEDIHEPRPKTFIRPPAVYTNRRHEDIIDYWLNVKI